jgi:hypothetical protein
MAALPEFDRHGDRSVDSYQNYDPADRIFGWLPFLCHGVGTTFCPYHSRHSQAVRKFDDLFETWKVFRQRGDQTHRVMVGPGPTTYIFVSMGKVMGARAKPGYGTERSPPTARLCLN